MLHSVTELLAELNKKYDCICILLTATSNILKQQYQSSYLILRLYWWSNHWNHCCFKEYILYSNSIKQTQFWSNNIFYLFYHTRNVDGNQVCYLSIDRFILQSNVLAKIPLNAVQLDAANQFRYSPKSQSVQIILKVYSM